MSFFYNSLIVKECPTIFSPCSAFIRPHLHILCLEDLLHATSFPAHSTSFSSLLFSFLFSNLLRLQPTPALTQLEYSRKKNNKIKHTDKTLKCLLPLFAFLHSPVGVPFSCPVSELIPLALGPSSSSLYCLWLKWMLSGREELRTSTFPLQIPCWAATLLTIHTYAQPFFSASSLSWVFTFWAKLTELRQLGPSVWFS